MAKHIKDDAAAVAAYLASQTTIIQREANEAEFPEIVYPELVPVITTGPEFAQSITYISTKHAGQAEWIDGNADDVPMADAKLQMDIKPVYTAGIGYGYGYAELQTAMLTSFDLTAERAIAAKRASEEMIDRVVMAGDSRRGLQGLGTLSLWTTSGITLDDWTVNGTTNDDIMVAINKLLMASVGNGSTPVADTLLIPPNYFAALFGRTHAARMIDMLTFATTSNVYTAMTGRPLTIRAVAALAGSTDASGNKVIAYRRSPDTLALHMPMPHRFLPVYQAGPLRFEVPGVMRIGGLNVRRKADTAEMHN